ncbi:MAG: c-type cytochrome [Thermoanaerobaculia bacterium]
MRPWRTGAVLALFLASPPLGAAEFDPHRVFTTLCSSCHTVGGGDALGPDLAGVTERRDREWLLDFMRAPREAIEAGDPVALTLYERYDRVMPDQDFAREELGLLLDYIAAGGPAAARPADEGPGRAEIGRRLFHGARSFTNGGAACSLCHSLSAGGAGGTLGGSLQKAGRRYSGPELANVLRHPTTPLMRSLYGDRVLTRTEATSVAVYLTSRDSPEPGPEAGVSAAASAPVLGLLTGLLLGLFGDLVLPAGWRRRR